MCSASCDGNRCFCRFNRRWYQSIKTSDPDKKHPPGAENYDPSESSQYRKINGKKVKEETMRGVYVYFIAYILILIVSVLLISINNFDFTTSFTGVLTTLNNVGPGLNLVGPVENFAKFSDFSKIVFCVDMLIGRLEIFPFLMLFSPSLWSRKF